MGEMELTFISTGVAVVLGGAVLALFGEWLVSRGSERNEEAMAVLEKEIEQKLKKMVERHGGLCLKWVCPGWLGVPDRICLLPGGIVIFVELKRPDGSGKLGAMQKWWARKLGALGFLHLWVKCEEDIAAMELLIQGRAEDGE